MRLAEIFVQLGEIFVQLICSMQKSMCAVVKQEIDLQLAENVIAS